MSERIVQQKVAKNMRKLQRRIDHDGGPEPLADFVRAALAHQLAGKPTEIPDEDPNSNTWGYLKIPTSSP